MPDSVEHRVEMHRLATERRSQGKPIWDRKIRLADVFHNDALTFEQQRDAIVKRIRSSGWIGLRYSSAKTSHISLGETSPPSPSVIFWTA